MLLCVCFACIYTYTVYDAKRFKDRQVPLCTNELAVLLSLLCLSGPPAREPLKGLN